MKFRLPTGVCILIALVLVAFGLLYGTFAGFGEDRAEVEALLHSDNGLLDVLGYRGADALNLHVVARRHLQASDADVLRLEAAAAILQNTDALLSEKKSADNELEAAVLAVSEKLHAAASFRQSQRDQKYLDMLTADLASLSASAAVSTYNRAAKAFNDQLDTPLVGGLAQWMGVEACPLFE